MSTLPGQDAWRDTGLAGPEPGEAVDLLRSGSTPEDAGEDYRPGVPRADVDGTATEADVADQAIVVDLGDGTPEGEERPADGSPDEIG